MGTDSSQLTNSDQPGTSDADARLCPACGYDLRGSQSDRCSECGTVVLQALLHESGVPWAHRRQIGRFKAFRKTVWQVTWDRRLRHELSKPQSWNDAKVFRRWNVVLLFAALVVATATFYLTDGIDDNVVKVRWNNRPPNDWRLDLHLPWSAGVVLLPAIPFYLLGLAIYLCGLGKSAYRLRHHPAVHQDRARTMSVYASAPLAWLLPAAVMMASMILFVTSQGKLGEKGHFWSIAYLLLSLLFLFFTIVGFVSPLYRSSQWITRAHHAGAARFLAALAELMCKSALGVFLFLGVLPWCVGLWWIMIDSYR